MLCSVNTKNNFYFDTTGDLNLNVVDIFDTT
jgi:hypothetical protein